MDEVGGRARRVGRSLGSGVRSAAHASRTAYRGTSRTVHRMTSASGAGRTGLANLIELTAAGSAADAFVAVALAGTLFFSTSPDQARGRVALALLITIAPFAVLAPLIGPMLDRVQQGRRYILMGTLLARGLLCWGMSGAAAHNDVLTLLPAAFGVLVLQKAYGVTRAAVVPRLLPSEITLVTANARSALASLVSSSLGAVVAVGIAFATGGASAGAAWVLRAGTVIYILATALGMRLPARVDAEASRADAARHTDPGVPPTAGPASARPHTDSARQRDGRTRPLPRGLAGRTLGSLPSAGPVVIEAVRANFTLRAYSGFMIFFLAFILRTVHFGHTKDTVALGLLIGAAALGGFAGTAIGSALRSRAPQLIVFIVLTLMTVITAVCAAAFGLWTALAVALAAALGQVLVKLALDSTLQREVVEDIRSSTFAVSESLHQLAWVVGGLLGLLASLTRSGVAGLAIAAAGLGIALIGLLIARRRQMVRARKRLPGALTKAPQGSGF